MYTIMEGSGSSMNNARVDAIRVKSEAAPKSRVLMLRLSTRPPPPLPAIPPRDSPLPPPKSRLLMARLAIMARRSLLVGWLLRLRTTGLFVGIIGRGLGSPVRLRIN